MPRRTAPSFPFIFICWACHCLGLHPSETICTICELCRLSWFYLLTRAENPGLICRDVEVVRADAPLQEAAQSMKARNIGYVLIREDGQSLGIVTDRDMTVRAAAEGRDPTTTTVREVMTPVIICCFEDDDIAAAVRC